MLDEKLDNDRDIHEVARELAHGKVMDVAVRYPDAIVIGSDTIVEIDNRQLEKPADRNEARVMLESYAGRESVVVTGVAVVCLNRHIKEITTDSTKVYFKADSQEVSRMREEYLLTGDWADKAGGYGIQNLRGTLIQQIEGDYDTVIGLPTKPLASILKGIGIDAAAVKVSEDLTYDDECFS